MLVETYRFHNSILIRVFHLSLYRRYKYIRYLYKLPKKESNKNCCICVFVLFRKKNHFGEASNHPRKNFFSMQTLYKFCTRPIIVKKNKVTSNNDDITM